MYGISSEPKNSVLSRGIWAGMLSTAQMITPGPENLGGLMFCSASYRQNGLSIVVISFMNSMEPPGSQLMSQMASIRWGRWSTRLHTQPYTFDVEPCFTISGRWSTSTISKGRSRKMSCEPWLTLPEPVNTNTMGPRDLGMFPSEISYSGSMLNLLPCLPLILLLPVASASTKYLDYYNKIPADYLAEFEQQDRFSALNRFVKDVAASPGLACSDGRSHFPLAAFRLSPAAADAVPDAGMSYKGFDQSKRAGLSMANLLSYMYQLADSQPSKWFQKTGDQAFWYSIVSSVVASDEKVFGCYAVLFDGKGRLNETVPHAFRNDSISRVVTVDSYSKTVSIQADSVGFEWLKYHHDNRERLLAQIRRRVGHSIVPNSKHNLMPFTSKLLKQFGGQVKVVTEAESFWTPPAFACQFGRWLVSYAVPFLNSGTADQLDIGGWVVLQFELERVEINQCRNESTFRSLYANNVCNQGTTECVHIPDQGLSDTNFYCKCRRYFHHGNFSGEQVRMQYLLHRKGSASNYSSLECGPCPAECPGSCATNGDCLIKHDLDILRALPLVIQTFLMTVCVLVAAIVFKTRRNRVIKAAVWILLEIFILGVTILYLTVFLMYLNPTYEICFIIPWFREIGFTITYGTLLVKVY
uniref:G_PROTEIN_RECEP_F3_4 domain-containing protein n=1 Tax=Macrostomum lignano TaxID=282301 RepID=A0A1I8I2D2_9PLAT